jgi:hypothetical protein
VSREAPAIEASRGARARRANGIRRVEPQTRYTTKDMHVIIDIRFPLFDKAKRFVWIEGGCHA